MSQPARTTAAQQLQPVVIALHEALADDLIALILFGSRARGDAAPDSDWDLLLLADNLPLSSFQRSRFIHDLLPEAWRYHLNVLCHTPAEWFSRVTPLALDIALDGIVLHDNSQGAIPDRLTDLRQQLTYLGLERQAIDNDWLWLWRDKPQPHWELEWAL